MGLRDDLQADIGEAFDDVDGLADAVQAFNGSREVVGEYDPVTGTTPTTTIAYSGRGVFGGYSVMELAGSSLVGTGETQGQHIQSTDVKLIALQNEVTLDDGGAQAEPKVDDRINGLLVINVKKDLAAASWTLQLRKT